MLNFKEKSSASVGVIFPEYPDERRNVGSLHVISRICLNRLRIFMDRMAPEPAQKAGPGSLS